MQLLRYYRDFFTGDLGESYLVMQGSTVMEVLSIVFPRTLELMIIPTIVIPFLGVKLGVTAATNQNKAKDQIIRGLGVSGVAFPDVEEEGQRY